MSYSPFINDLLISAGKVAGMSDVRKFGRNVLVGTTEEDLWSAGGTYPWPTAAETVRVKAGGDVNDTAAGTGAVSVTIVGLDETWTEVSETVATAGASASAATTITFCRVYRAFVEDVGAYGGNNAGAIDIENTSSTNVVAHITAGIGQSQLGLYTVPAGKTGYLHFCEFLVEGSKDASVRLWRREQANNVSTPFTSKRLVLAHDKLIGAEERPFHAHPTFPEKTDVWASAFTSSGTTSVSVGFDIVLVDN